MIGLCWGMVLGLLWVCWILFAWWARGNGMVSFVVVWYGFLARVVGLCMMMVGGCVCWPRFLSLVVVWVWL